MMMELQSIEHTSSFVHFAQSQVRIQFRVNATFSSSVYGFVSFSYRNRSVHLFDSCLSCLRSASSRQLWPSAEHRLMRASLRSCDKAKPRLGLHRIGSAQLGSAATGTVEQGGGQRVGRMRLMPRSHQLDGGLAELRFQGELQCRFA